MKQFNIIIISDGIGDTAREMADAVLSQFDQEELDLNFIRYMNVRSQGQLDAVFFRNDLDRSLILYTVVDQELNSYLVKKAIDAKVKYYDLIGPVLKVFEDFFHISPRFSPGVLHAVNDDYYERVSAMEFTLQNDDGKNLSNLDEADVVLVGISRTSKTPLSIYLSQKYSAKVVNIPLVKGTRVPEELYKIDHKKIFALTISPYALHEIRKNRLERLGVKEYPSNYADMASIIDEVEWANQIFKENRKWPLFDVTGKAIEETAAEIMEIFARRNKRKFFSL